MEYESQAHHYDFLNTLPPVSYAFAYGSAAFPQTGRGSIHGAKDAMVDYILAVDSPRDWHHENLKENRSHYRSPLFAVGGSSAVTWVADSIGAGVHFNPYVQFQRDKKVKYGVISVESLAEDLTSWNRLYISGRMHKPVKLLVDDRRISELQQYNLRAALAAALLSLPNTFCEKSLFLELCGLSYRGDIRTFVGAEDAHKVRGIVEGNKEGFRLHYRDSLQDLINKGVLVPVEEHSSTPSHFEKISTKQSRKTLLECLPTSVIRQIAHDMLRVPSNASAISPHEVADCIADGYCNKLVAHALQSTARRRVFFSSSRQAVAALITSGAAASLAYLARKASVGLKSRWG